jgi:hypothetical protein
MAGTIPKPKRPMGSVVRLPSVPLISRSAGLPGPRGLGWVCEAEAGATGEPCGGFVGDAARAVTTGGVGVVAGGRADSIMIWTLWDSWTLCAVRAEPPGSGA